MSFGMLTVLKTVPWTDVIGAAPGVVGGARKLWAAVSDRQGSRRLDSPPADGQETIATLSARLANAEAMMADFQAQFISATAIISSLADQNANLITKAEVGRKQLMWLASISAGALGLAIVSIILVLLRT